MYRYLQDDAFPSIRQHRAWDAGLTGKGIVISIVDDGLEHTNPELAANYDPDASHDYNSLDSDPFPVYTPSNINKHGTRCAGVSVAPPRPHWHCIHSLRIVAANPADKCQAFGLRKKYPGGYRCLPMPA